MILSRHLAEAPGNEECLISVTRGPWCLIASFIGRALASLITMAPTLLVTTREPDTGFCDHITGDTSQTQTLCVVSGAVIV